MRTTSSFDKNSHTPSLAITMNLSDSLRFISRTSGSAMHPTYAAQWSPKDLDMAKPGMFSFRCQTR